jgi:hypothetical protein
VTGTDGATVGTGVSGKVRVGTGVGGEGTSVGVGAGVRGTGVMEIDGDALEDGDGDVDGLADGAAICCDEMTAAPRRSSATRAIAANTVKTVDQRSAGRRGAMGRAGGATFVPAGGRSSSAVASGSTRGGFSSTAEYDGTRRADGRTPARSAARRDGARSRPGFRGRPGSR